MLASGACTLLCTANCKTCLSGLCTECFPGYLLPNSQCVACPASYSKCTSSTVCSIGNSGYYLSSSGVYTLNCPANCKTCGTTGACTVCYSGYQHLVVFHARQNAPQAHHKQYAQVIMGMPL